MTKKRMTSAERKVSEQLDLMGLQYECEYKVEGHRADFWLPAVDLVIEANGDWWHRTDMWLKTDAKKIARWRAAGVRFLGVWESRIDKEPFSFREALRMMIEDPKCEAPFWDWAVPDVR